MLPNISPSNSGGNQPIFEDCLDLRCAVETQFLSPDTIVPPQKSSAGPEEEQQVLARLGGQPGGGSANNHQCYSSQAQATSGVRDEADVSGRGRSKGSPIWVCCSRENSQERTPLPYI